MKIFEKIKNLFKTDNEKIIEDIVNDRQSKGMSVNEDGK
jgi:hypothetical protein